MGSLALFASRLVPKISRTMHEFAETEVKLPKGPRRGLYFDLDFAPFNKFIFDAMMDPYWRKVSILGPTQNGKSLLATNIPLLYYLFEEEEDVIFGLPTMDLASGMWVEKLRPVIEDSQYAQYLPTKGAGSRGGKFTAVQFKNGANLRFMAAGGSAEQMSSHSAKVVLMTEIDKYDTSAGDGSEADPVSLIQMRADAFEDSKIVMECTVTNEQGRIWQEAMVQGSGSEIYVACPYCKKHQTLEREGLVFDAADQVTAEKTARYQCSHCEEKWDNNDRLEALQDPLLVHKGQVVENGVVTGDLPPTKAFGMRYNVLHSPMQSLAKTAGQQWEADVTDLKEKKKAMIQSKWSLPYVDEDAVRDQLNMQALRNKADGSDCQLGTVPDWADVLTFGTDVQKGYCYFKVEAYNLTTMKSVVVEYGTVDQRQDTDVGIMNMLSEVNDIAMEGWPTESGETMVPECKMVDCGYRYDVIALWLQTNPSWYGIKGVGKGLRSKMTGKKEVYKIDGIVTVRQQDNGQKLWFIEVDNTKALVHDRYLLQSEELDYYRYVPRDVDIGWLKHITAEEREYDPLGETFKWKKTRRRNDYLDIASYNVAGSYILREKANRSKKRNEQQVKKNHEAIKGPRKSKEQGKWFSDRGSKLN